MKSFSECKWRVDIVGYEGAYHWVAHTVGDVGCLLTLEQNGCCDLRWGAKRNWIHFSKINNFKNYKTWNRILKKYI